MCDLLIKYCQEDIVLTISVLMTDRTEKSTTLLINSTDDWSLLTGGKDIYSVMGFFGRSMLNDLIDDYTVFGFMIQFCIINNDQVDHKQTKKYFRKGGAFYPGTMAPNGIIHFTDDKEI